MTLLFGAFSYSSTAPQLVPSEASIILSSLSVKRAQGYAGGSYRASRSSVYTLPIINMMTIAEPDCRDQNSKVLLSIAASDVLGRNIIKSDSTFLAAVMWSRPVTAGEPEF